MHDRRQFLSRRALPSTQPVLCSKLYGGSSAWRLATLKSVRFNLDLVLHYTEDIYYSMTVNKVLGYPCTSILTHVSSIHSSTTNTNRYNFHIFRQRLYEQYVLARTFDNSAISTLWSYTILLTLYLLEVLVKAPLLKKASLSLAIFLALIDSLFPLYKYHTTFGPPSPKNNDPYPVNVSTY